jgi:hypothetical protein
MMKAFMINGRMIFIMKNFASESRQYPLDQHIQHMPG